MKTRDEYVAIMKRQLADLNAESAKREPIGDADAASAEDERGKDTAATRAERKRN